MHDALADALSLDDAQRAWLARAVRVGVCVDVERVRAWHAAGAEPPLQVVGGALLRQGELFAAQRATGALAGLWEFPGGKLEPGETPETALVRELEEELGVHIEPGPVLGSVLWFAGARLLELFVVPVHRWQGVPQAREHQALCWVGLDALDTLTWAPADVPLLALVRRYAA